MKRFTHPAIKALILDYFFSGTSCLGSIDVETFGPLIPIPTMAIVITAVRHI